MCDYLFVNEIGQLLAESHQPTPDAAHREAERLAAQYRARTVTVGVIEERIEARLCSCGYAYEIKPGTLDTLYCPDCEVAVEMSQPLFPLGTLLITPGAAEALRDIEQGQEYVFELMARHVSGDWSEMAPEDQEANRQAIEVGARVFSAYYLPDGQTKLWIITEANRSSTTVLLPSEY